MLKWQRYISVICLSSSLMQLEKDLFFSTVQYLVTAAEVLEEIILQKISLLRTEYFVVSLKSSQTKVILPCNMIQVTRADAGNQSPFWQKDSIRIFFSHFFCVMGWDWIKQQAAPASKVLYVACLFLLSKGAAQVATVLQGYLESADCSENFRSCILQSHLKKPSFSC